MDTVSAFDSPDAGMRARACITLMPLRGAGPPPRCSYAGQVPRPNDAPALLCFAMTRVVAQDKHTQTLVSPPCCTTYRGGRRRVHGIARSCPCRDEVGVRQLRYTIPLVAGCALVARSPLADTTISDMDLE